MDIISIIKKKGEMQELSREEIRHFVKSYNKKGGVTQAQAAALFAYIYENGMTVDEIAELVRVMVDTGDVLNLSAISPNIVDKHSTGGVGDKVTLLLMPIAACLGVPFAKISGRTLGGSSGTIDKLESIPGFTADIPQNEFIEIIKKYGVGILNQNMNFVPVESKMYKLRNELGFSDSLPLIAASLLSLKMATGANKFIFEIACGPGTYINNMEKAKKLARLLKEVGKKLDKEVVSVVTLLNEPLGYAIGHNLEIEETVDSLKGKIAPDLLSVVETISAEMLHMVDPSTNLKDNIEKVRKVIDSNEAYEKFEELVEAQHGDISYLGLGENFRKSRYIMPVFSESSGYILSIDADMVGSIARYLGAGRMNDEKEINREAGIVLTKKVGDKVESGEAVAYIHTDDEDKVLSASKNLQDAFKFTKNKSDIPKSRIIEIV